MKKIVMDGQDLVHMLEMWSGLEGGYSLNILCLMWHVSSFFRWKVQSVFQRHSAPQTGQAPIGIIVFECEVAILGCFQREFISTF